jgi:hypothetical protein
MRLVRSCRRVKESKDLGERTKDQGTAVYWGGSKDLERVGNKMWVSLVSSIAFP